MPQLCGWHRWSQILLKEQRSDKCMCQLHCFQRIILLLKLFSLITSLMTQTLRFIHLLCLWVSPRCNISMLQNHSYKSWKSTGRQPYYSISQSHTASLYSTLWAPTKCRTLSQLSLRMGFGIWLLHLLSLSSSLKAAKRDIVSYKNKTIKLGLYWKLSYTK